MVLQEAEKLFEKIISDHAEITLGKSARTLGERAKTELNEIRNLAIGRAAPDIEGEDIDGNKFKLSDYRGKVVVLDFWGHW
jgi:cytochrome oxidase Cu insertion factor (SCO1/SenC/PrrC family)